MGDRKQYIFFRSRFTLVDLHSSTLNLQLFILLNQMQVIPGIDTCSDIPTTKICKTNFKDFPEAGYCVATYDILDSNFEADTDCINEGSRLASIKSPTEDWFIQQSVPKSNKKHYIGLMSAATSFEWADVGKISSETKLTYTNWNPHKRTSPHGSENCVVRDASTGLWEPTDCLNKLGFICATHYAKAVNTTLKLNNGYSPPNVVYPGQEVFFECTAYTFLRGKVILLLKRGRKWQNVTAEKVAALNGEYTKDIVEITDREDCMRKWYVGLSFPADKNILGFLEPYKCCLMISSMEADCSKPVEVQIKYPDPTKPRLIVHYHNPAPTLYLGLKLHATCIANGGELSWALLSSSETAYWSPDQSGVMNPSSFTANFTKGVEIEVVDERDDRILGHVKNVSFSVTVKEYHNESILACFSHSIASKAEARNAQDPLRMASAQFRVDTFYPPHILNMKVSYHQGWNVLFKRKPFNASCSAAVGTGGYMIFALRQKHYQSSWRISFNGTETILRDEIRYRYKKDIGYFFDPVQGPILQSNISFIVRKDMKNTVISCSTEGIRDPTIKNGYWKQNRKTRPLLVYEQPCFDTRLGPELRQHAIAQEDHSLVHYSCRDRRYVPFPIWPVECHRNYINGSLVWNATPPVCVPRPPLVSWFTWFKWFTWLGIIISVIIFLIFPYDCCFKAEEKGEGRRRRRKRGLELYHGEETDFYAVHQADNIVRHQPQAMSVAYAEDRKSVV